ncbi:MAG: NADH:flavin oxidoreductase, partial [Actinomycetota bacterium]
MSDPLVTGKFELKNRIVMPPMANDMATPDGAVTDNHIEHYSERARGGPGLVIVEHSYIMPSGRMTEKQLGIHADRLVPGLTRLAGAIREAGARCAIQLTHAGANTDESICDCTPAGPSELPLPGRDQKPRALKREEIPEIIAAYESAAGRAV